MTPAVRRAAARTLLVAGVACKSSSGPETVTVSGTVHDYFTGAPLAATVSFEVVSLTTTSSGTGAYQMASVPINSAVSALVTAGSYRATRNPFFSVITSPVTADLRGVASADVSRQYTAAGVTATAGTAVLFAELVTSAGAAREGIPAADIRLVNGSDASVGSGPYFFAASGDIVSTATLSTSTAFGGHARVAFLNVPVGTATLKVTVSTPAVSTLTAQVLASADGVTLVER